MSDNIQKAVETYMQREAAAMKTQQGADHRVILREVADEYGLTYKDLREAVIDATATWAN